jgi:hypothetical protein
MTPEPRKKPRQPKENCPIGAVLRPGNDGQSLSYRPLTPKAPVEPQLNGKETAHETDRSAENPPEEGTDHPPAP